MNMAVRIQKVLGGKITVMVLGRSQDISSRLESDLEVLGFKPLLMKYPDVDTAVVIHSQPDIILLDLTVCDHDALSICEFLLNENNLPPGIAMIAVVSEYIVGQIPIDKFADIIKYPCDIAELGFRLRRMIHGRNHEFAEETISIGDVSLSPSTYEVKVKGQLIFLTYREYELLKYLITHPNRVFTREMLLTSVWGYDPESDSRTVDVHIRRLRAKIGDIDQTHIKTIRGVGYAFRFKNY